MQDKLLVYRCRRGSRDALRRIYEKYRDYLLITAFALCHDKNLAEDAVHDTFVRFAENVKTFELTGNLKAYLAVCVANKVRDFFRSRTCATVPLDESNAGLVLADPASMIEVNEQLRLLGAALAELPDEQRETVVLRIYGRMRFKDIAKSTGVSVNTIKGRYRYAINRLRSIMNELEI